MTDIRALERRVADAERELRRCENEAERAGRALMSNRDSDRSSQLDDEVRRWRHNVQDAERKLRSAEDELNRARR